MTTITTAEDRPDQTLASAEPATVKPSEEAVMDALLAARPEVFAQRGVMHPPNDPADERERASARIYARAVLAALPGRTEQEVKAEALRELRPTCPIHGIPDCSPLLNGCRLPACIKSELGRHADRIEREG